MVFADLVGSTVLGEALDAEALRHVTGCYFDAMRRAAERHGGSVEKFIGDAVVAVFGVPRVREDDALRAVRAAAEMRGSLAELNDELGRDLGVALEVRIGVNTGEVIVGERRGGGSGATGDAVNVAARLEQAAGPGEVLLGDSTLRLVRGEVTVEPREPLQLKGKARPVVAWRLVDVAGSARAAKGLPGNLFVGRDAQLRLLDDAFWRVVGERTCLLVTVLGTAGMGKTRLAEEFVARLSEATVLMGRCLSYGQGATYWPVREAVLGAAELTGDEPAGAAEAAFAAVLGESPDTANVVTRLLALTGFNRQGTVPEDYRGRCGCSSSSSLGGDRWCLWSMTCIGRSPGCSTCWSTLLTGAATARSCCLGLPARSFTTAGQRGGAVSSMRPPCCCQRWMRPPPSVSWTSTTCLRW